MEYNRNKLELTQRDIQHDISNRWREDKIAINLFKIAFNDLTMKSIRFIHLKYIIRSGSRLEAGLLGL